MSNSYDALMWSIHVSKGLDPMARILLICGLAPRVNDNNGFMVWPSRRQIAEDCGMSVSTVKRYLKVLVEEGLVEVYPALRENGAKSSNRYNLPVRTTHYHPRTGAIVLDNRGRGQADPGGGVTLTHGWGQADPGGGVTADPCNMNSRNRTESIEPTPPDGGGAVEPELGLGLPPLPTPEETERAIVQHVEDGWRALAEEVPAVAALRGAGGRLDDARAKTVVQRARNFIGDGMTETGVWDAIFAQIRRSSWLCGEAEPGPGRSPFRLQMTWLLELRNFTKVLEGKYDSGRDPTVPGGGAPTRISPAGKAVLSVIDRNRARRERGAGGGSRGIAHG